MSQPAPQRTQASQREDVSFAESELKIALLFADLSMTAYRVGRLGRACDTRSKAESLCRRAAARLNASETGTQSHSRLREVLDRLARLPEFRLQARAAS